MTAAQVLAKREGFLSEAVRRKRLGQYFTGTALGRLLGVLACCKRAQRIIDPMAGRGDILAACLELGASPHTIGAIDIDPLAQEACAQRLPNTSPLLGSAFSPQTLRLLPYHQWDLVITNPPYVRYQSLSRGAGEGFKLPSSMEVRTDLLAALKELPGLDHEDKRLFKKLAESYSGLADLAVPSWILCSALCALGGRLALVVPESWLSRDFAAVVHYILLRWFRIEYVVEDAHAAWFSDAQIKTTLLIAERIPRKDSAFQWEPEASFLKIRLARQTIGKNGVVDNLYPGAEHPEEQFALDAQQWLISGETVKKEWLEVQPVSLAHTAENFLRTCKKHKWFRGVGERVSSPTSATADYGLPAALSQWLAAGSEHPEMVTLEALGVQVGQGLRTGANGFFYATAVEETPEGIQIESAPVLGRLSAVLQHSWALPVLRKQSDLPDGFIVDAKALPGRVLALQTCALPEDISAGGSLTEAAYSPMPETLAVWVRAAERANFGTESEPKRITDLTAVIPNIRKGNTISKTPPRFWYMLPDFAPRHKPDLLVARINQVAPRAFLNKDKGAIVDANFATLWLQKNSVPDSWALLAMLNSSWCSAILESSASVMGGGALKVEASHLRRLPLPCLNSQNWNALSELGKALGGEPAGSIQALEEINHLIASALLGRKAEVSDLHELHKIAKEGQVRRQNHSKKGKCNEQ